MKATEVVQTSLTYPLHEERLHTFTMFPAWNMLHSIQFPPHHAAHHKLHPDKCADAYPSVQQTATLWTAPQSGQKVQQMKKKTSRWYSLDAEHWTLEETPDYEDYMVTSSD